VDADHWMNVDPGDHSQVHKKSGAEAPLF